LFQLAKPVKVLIGRQEQMGNENGTEADNVPYIIDRVLSACSGSISPEIRGISILMAANRIFGGILS
jgi:hypothetical protein